MNEILPSVSVVLTCVQGVVGVGIVLGALLLLLLGTDRNTPILVRWPIIGLLGWGVWFTYIAVRGYHDSPPAIALALAVAVVLLKYGRQIRGILDGETWWPKAGRAKRKVPRSA